MVKKTGAEPYFTVTDQHASKPKPESKELCILTSNFLANDSEFRDEKVSLGDGAVLQLQEPFDVLSPETPPMMDMRRVFGSSSKQSYED